MAKEIMMGAMDAAVSLVREGKAVAIGEMGRPHFPVSEEMMAASNEILSHGMRLCKEAGCAIVIHSESATPETLADLARMADRVGLDRGKVVKHYCAPLVTAEENHGVFPSVLASKSAFARLWAKGTASCWRRISWTTRPDRGRCWGYPPCQKGSRPC